MKLSDWLKKDGRTRSAFAADIGVVPSYVTMLCSDECWPSRPVAERIAEATNNEVTPNDFLGVAA